MKFILISVVLITLFYYIYCAHEAQAKEGMRTILVGNPGTGKSTILNALLGKAKFASGISLGHGKTKILQWERDSNGDWLGDTPGLSDEKFRKQAAEEIRKALQHGGLFRIIFVLTTEAGRIRPDDKTTMKLVLESAPIGSSYGIIINKEIPEVIDSLKDPHEMQEFIAYLNEGLPGTFHLFFNEFKAELQGKGNVVINLQDLLEFLDTVPIIDIPKEKVVPINYQSFNEQKEELKKDIEMLKENNQKMADIIAKQNHDWLRMRQEQEQERRRIEESHKAEMERIRYQAEARATNSNKSSSGLFGFVGEVLGGLFSWLV